MSETTRFGSLVLGSLVLALALAACGGGASPGAVPDAPSADDAAPSVDDAAPSAPKDGIVRDADGDGQPDDMGGGCEGKTQTQCQITAGCAWSDEDKCVEGGDSPM
ncbi:MAG: hypothetical protein R3B72_11095 [Polyangiaceae bacterium]